MFSFPAIVPFFLPLLHMYSSSSSSSYVYVYTFGIA